MKYGCHSMYEKINSVLIKRPSEAFISEQNLNDSWEVFNYIEKPNYNDAVEEYEAFEKIIRDNIKEVIYLNESDEVGLDSIYTHDSLKITNEGAIYFNTGKKLRQNERFETKKLLESYGIKTLGEVVFPGKMEGGDVVWLDDRRVAIALGYRTNQEGIDQFKEITKDIVDEVIVVPLPHALGEDECLHLMSVISIIDKDLAVVYSKYMPVFFREWLIHEGYSLIEVSDIEYDNLGSNVLALAPRKCLIMDGNEQIKNDLISNGCEVITYKGKNISFLGTGGPTCLTSPISRG